MASRESKISKQAASSITRHTTFTIMETLEIIRKPASVQAGVTLWQHTRVDCSPSMVQRNKIKKLPVRT